MPRPVLDERVTIRIPAELLNDYLDRAARRNCSLNDCILTAMENDAAHALTYQVDYYRDLRPLVADAKGDIVRHRPPMADKGLN